MNTSNCSDCKLERQRDKAQSKDKMKKWSEMIGNAMNIGDYNEYKLGNEEDETQNKGMIKTTRSKINGCLSRRM